MSESQTKERMNSIFQESNLRGLPEPEPGVDSRGEFTLTWTSGSVKINVIFTPALYLTVDDFDTIKVDFNVATETDSEVIDRVEREIAAAAG